MSEAVQRKPNFGRLPIPNFFTASAKGHSAKDTNAHSQDQVSASHSDAAMDTLKVHDYSRLNIRGDAVDKSPPATRKKDLRKQPHCSKCQRMMELSGNPKPKPSQDEKERKKSKPAPDDKLLCRGANPRTGVVSPSEISRDSPSPATSSRSSPTPHSGADKQEARTHGGREKSPVRVKSTTPPKVSRTGGATPESTTRSQSSISPMSGRGGSANGWQDQFVVNMPSARDPSPPAMSPQQILEFQQSLGNVHRSSCRRLESDSVPSPNTKSNDTARSTAAKKVEALPVPNRPESRRKVPLVEADSDPSMQPTGVGQYYSADEVGQPRFHASRDSPTPTLKAGAARPNKDGSFLGCLDANRPEVKNPDEILLFHNLAQKPTVAQPALCRSRKRAEDMSRKRDNPAVPAAEDKKAVQEEWKPISQNLKLAQCSKPSPKTLCQQPNCKSNQDGKSKENAIPSIKAAQPQQRPKADNSKGDNASTTIPTTTRTTKATGAAELMDKERPDVPQRPARTPGNVRARVRIKTPPRPHTVSPPESRSAAMSATPSPASTPPVVTPTEKRDVQPPKTTPARDMRGSIRTSGDAKAKTDEPTVAEDSAARPPASHATGRGTGASNTGHQAPESAKSPHVRSSSYTRPIPSLNLGNKDKRKGATGLRPISTTGFAELDGRQVEDEADGPSFYRVPHVNTNMPRAGVRAACRSPSEQQTLSLLFEIFLLSAGQLQGLFWGCTTNRHGKFALGKIIHMAEHCMHIFRRILVVFTIYKKTGSWVLVPDEEDPVQFITDVAEAVVYLVILGLILAILGRTAGYLVLVGSWVIWLMKPFGWLFARIGGALAG